MSPEQPTAEAPAKRDRNRQEAERHDMRVAMLVVFVVCLGGIASIAADYFLLEGAVILKARFVLDATVLSEGFLMWAIPGAFCYLFVVFVVYPYVVVSRQSLRCYTDGIYQCRRHPARCWDCKVLDKVLDKLGFRSPRTALKEEPL